MLLGLTIMLQASHIGSWGQELLFLGPTAGQKLVCKLV